jgi:hypothetical protein
VTWRTQCARPAGWQGLLNRIGNFSPGNPDSQQNTRQMLTGMLYSPGYSQVTVNFTAGSTRMARSR